MFADSCSDAPSANFRTTKMSGGMKHLDTAHQPPRREQSERRRLRRGGARAAHQRAKRVASADDRGRAQPVSRVHRAVDGARDA